MDFTLGRNTKEKGKFTLFVYKEKPNYYIGVCLEFDLLAEGSSLEEAMQRIDKICWNYLQIVIENNWSDELLNKSAPKEYWEKFIKFLKIKMMERMEERERRERQRQYWENYIKEQIYNPNIFKRNHVQETRS